MPPNFLSGDDKAALSALQWMQLAGPSARQVPALDASRCRVGKGAERGVLAISP